MGLPATIGPYTVVRELGRGGMGVVYEVRHPRAGRPLALKQLLQGEQSPTALDRFTREATALARVRHPNVVGLLAFDLALAGPYLVTELVQGTSLKELAPLEPRRAAEVVRALADGLAAVHAAGVLHRDLKPDNAILRSDGQPVLIDFGLSREQHARTLTADGSILGTPAYMAPEQLGASRELDARADVYGLGAVLFFLLSGRPPFQGETVEILARVVRREPDWPADLPPGLLPLLRRAMAKERDQRPADATALRDELGAWLAGRSAGRRRPGLALGLLGLLAVGAVGAGLAFRPAGPPAPPLPPPPGPVTTAPPVPPAAEGVARHVDDEVAALASAGLLPWERATRVQATGDPIEGPSRRDHIQGALAWDAGRGCVWLLGGLRRTGPEAGECLGDLWSWDGTYWREHPLEGSPTPRYGHVVVRDPARDVLVVYGGLTTYPAKTGFDGATWELDLAAQRWSRRSAAGPGPRAYGGAAWSPSRRAVLLFGGTHDKGGLVARTDLQAWDGRAWREVPCDGPRPPACSRLALAADPERERLFVLGGAVSGGRLLGDLWTFEGGAWSSTPAPLPPRLGTTLVHDGRRLLVFGGSTSTAIDPMAPDRGMLRDTWVLEATGWRELQPGLAPAARSCAGAVYDPKRRVALLVGGVDWRDRTPVEGTTWAYPLGLLP